jgi:hypothetical protein
MAERKFDLERSRQLGQALLTGIHDTLARCDVPIDGSPIDQEAAHALICTCLSILHWLGDPGGITPVEIIETYMAHRHDDGQCA